MLTKVQVPGCRGTLVQRLLSGDGLQVLSVDVEPGGEIPLHSHDCAATMVITKGRARALGNSPRLVAAGDVVVKAPKDPHGFAEISEPFSFISISDRDGILHNDGWDVVYE